MAGLFFEGFEWLGSGTSRDDATTWLQKVWLAVAIGSGAGAFVTTRTGNHGVDMDGAQSMRTAKLRQPNDSDTTIVFGFYLETPATFTGLLDVLRVWCGEAIQCAFETNNDGTLDFQRGTSVTLGTSTFAFSASNKYYVEFKIVIADGTSGSMEMKVADITANGDNAAPTQEWLITGVDTRGSASSFETSWDSLQLISWNNNTRYDDIYVCDGSGAQNNDFLGNLIVETLNPNAAGASTQLTPSTGSNWENVDETTIPDIDSTYNTADANAETDLYNLESQFGTGAPLAVQGHVFTRVTEGNPRKVRLPFRSGTTTSEGTDLTSADGDDYTARRRVLELDPDTSASFTVSGINALQFGIKRQS